MKIEVKVTKSDLGAYLVNAKSANLDETVILNSESDAEKTAQFTEKVFGGDYEKFEIYAGESNGNPVIVAVCNKKIAYVFTSEDENALAAVLMFAKVIAMKIKSAAKAGESNAPNANK